jgi:hypothetical protein
MLSHQIQALNMHCQQDALSGMISTGKEFLQLTQLGLSAVLNNVLLASTEVTPTHILTQHTKNLLAQAHRNTSHQPVTQLSDLITIITTAHT